MEKELILKKPEVFLYKIPRQIHGQDKYITFRAADWDIARPTWHGKLFVYKTGLEHESCLLELRDGHGTVYRTAVLTEYPGKDLWAVLDSSRYFTLNVRNGDGSPDLVGIGFANRSDSAALLNAVRNCLHKNGNNKRGLDSESETDYEGETEEPPRKKIRNNEVHPEDDISTEWKPSNSEKLLAHFFEYQACMLCNRDFFSKNQLFRHLQDKHYEGPDAEIQTIYISANIFETEEESQPGNPSQEITELNRNDSGQPLLNCVFCAQDFPSREEIIQHFRDSHRTNQTSEEREIGKRKSELIPCIVCGKKINENHKDEHLLTVHVCDPSGRTILRPNPTDFSCEGCQGWLDPRNWKWKHLASCHNYVPTTYDIFSCPECQKTIKGKSGLSHHIYQVHSQEGKLAKSLRLAKGVNDKLLRKPDKVQAFDCTLCWKHFATPKGRRRHYRKEHPGVDVPGNVCPSCGREFQSMSALLNHHRKEHAAVATSGKPSASVSEIITISDHKSRVRKRKKATRKLADLCNVLENPGVLSQEPYAEIEDRILENEGISENMNESETPREFEETEDNQEQESVQSNSDDSVQILNDEEEGANNARISRGQASLIEPVELPTVDFSCTLCEKYFASTKGRKKHYRIKHDGIKAPPIFCPICKNKRILSTKALSKHWRKMHSGEALPKIQDPDQNNLEILASSLVLTKDLPEVSETVVDSNEETRMETPVVAPSNSEKEVASEDLREEVSLSPAEIKRHQENIKWNVADFFKKLKCAFCEEQLGSRDNLIQHFRSVHQKEPKPAGISAPTECLLCKQILESKETLDEHLLTLHLCNPSWKPIHTPGPNEFACDACEGWFCFKANKWGHKRGCSPKKVAKKHSIQLAEDVRVATSMFQKTVVENPEKDKVPEEIIVIDLESTPSDKLTCPVCKTNFQVLKNLRRHYRRLHKEMPVPEYLMPPIMGSRKEVLHPLVCNCPICGEGFPTQSKLRDHLTSTAHNGLVRKHPQRGSYECFRCRVECHTLDDLISHLVSDWSCSVDLL